LRAHITLLPPRRLQTAEGAALEFLEEVCRPLAAIHVSLANVETFLPVSPTVYLAVENGARHLRYLHGVINAGPLLGTEPWEYIPHVTLANLPNPGSTRSARELVAARWAAYQQARDFMVEELAFVREEEADRWVDLGRQLLGG
jgi:2'-5' RNA ligase